MPIDLAAKDISIELFSDYLTLTLGIIKKVKLSRLIIMNPFHESFCLDFKSLQKKIRV